MIKRTIGLTEECKEKEIEISSLREKLKRKENIKNKHYTEWTSDELIDFIINLEDGKFKCYQEILRINLNDEDVDGESIKFVEKKEWKEWGIKDYKHRTIIHQNIQNLIKQNINNDDQQQQEKGRRDDGTNYF